MPTEEEVARMAALLRQSGASDEEVAKRIKGLDAEIGRKMAEADAQKPSLYVARDRLHFQAGGKSVQIPLAALIERGEAAVVPLLLYAGVLQLRDLNASLRQLADVAVKQAERVGEMQDGGAQKIIGDVVSGLRDLGIFPPPVPGARVPGANGGGKGSE